MSKHLQKTCVYCGNSFTTSRKETETCSKRCAAFKCQPREWVQCSICMATVGLGIKTAAKLIGRISPGAVASAWQARGVKKQDPPDGSWHLYARRRGMHGCTKKLPDLPWWGDQEAAKGWQSNNDSNFPDWSSIWTKEKARRYQRDRYANFTIEEKKAWSRACLERRKSSPEQMEKQREKSRRWKRKNPERNRESAKKSTKARKVRDPGFKIACNLRNRFKEIMEVVRDPSRKWNSSLIGCDTHQLARHLESQFKRGMSWSNYGTHWHVDHIIPCAAFDHTDPKQVRQCWHFTNLRPLEAKANLAKSSRIEEPQLALLL